MNKIILAFLFTLAACDHEKPQSISAIALFVPDGESIIVNVGREQRVRLCGVSVSDQGQGKKLLQALVKPDTKVALISAGTNLAEVFVPTSRPEEEKNLSAELLLAGLATYKESDNCPNGEVFKTAQDEEITRKVGIWKSK